MDAPEAAADLVAVLGPTASGKSALALALGEDLDGEILCCDSMQVYRGMDIGTGKPTPDERRRLAHHLLDLVDPGQAFHAAQWAERARAAIAEVAGRGRLPLVVGGTGLYFRALTRGLFEAPPSDPDIRRRHQAEAAAAPEGAAALHRRLAEIDPEAAARILPNDLLRTSRALEVWEQTGIPISRLRRQAPPPASLRIFAIVLDPSLDELRVRIRRRVDEMMAAGFVDEVARLRATGHGAARALQALGYRQIGLHLDGALTLEQAVADTRRATAAYARRQRTWFRREEAAVRSPAPDPDALASAIRAWRGRVSG